MILNIGSGKSIWLEGHTTNGLVDDEYVRLIGYIKCTGTKSYTTVTGASRTVHSVRFLNAKETEEIEAANREQERIAYESQYRTWTDSTGAHTFKGKYLQYKASTVHIEGKDKKVRKVFMAKLSKSDQKWIREQLKAAHEANESKR